jgi:hypothetical protein
MAIYDFFLSRNGAPVTRETYAGHPGRLFYDDDTGEIRLGDGETAGGFPIPITLATETVAGSVKPSGSFSLDPTDGTLTLRTATDERIGGIRLGPGVVTNPQGQLIIDTEGLEFSFGDFSSFIGVYEEGAAKAGEEYALLQSNKEDQDIVIASNGEGSVNLVGEFRVFRSNETLDDTLTDIPVFRLTEEGRLRILLPNADGVDGALEIIGNDNGARVSPNQVGVVLHTTGTNGEVGRNYFDGDGSYALLVGRRYNGTADVPSQVLNGELFFRIAGQANTTDGFQLFGPCQIDWVATEDQGPDNQGGELRLRATPNGTSAFTGIVDVATFNATTGVTSDIGFVGDLTGTATTATNLAAAANILTGTVVIDPPLINRVSSVTLTAAVTGLTTNHKVIVTSQTEIEVGITVSAAFASAADTLSVQFVNSRANNDINPSAKTIQYFAWV